MNKQRITNLIGAGTMVVIVLAIGLLLSGGNRPNVSADSSAPTTQIAEPLAVNALQAENDALQQVVTTYQLREVEYAAQIELANELLAAQSASSVGEPAHEDDHSANHEAREHEEHDD
jgi:hypothetical protein